MSAILPYRLIRTRFATAGDFTAPAPASDEDILLAHDPQWVSKLRSGTLTYQDILRLEIPYSRQMVEAFWLAAGGTILAARLALETGVGFNLGGGFHHAFPDHGEGFCAINDMAVAIRRLQRDGAIRRAMVVDCDVHHGNGTAAISPATIPCSRSPFTSSTIIRPRSLPRAWTFTWRTGLAMRSISSGWGTRTARHWRCSSRSW